MNSVTTTTARENASMTSTSLTVETSWTRRLLACGMMAGPLFLGVALVQAFTRPGFDFKRHALSQLSLGDLGWIQVANFLASGLLTVLFAIGIWKALRHGRAGTWGPVLVAVYGAGTFAAGLFSTDPSVGFPRGAPEGLPESLSWHAMLHGVAFFVAFASLVAACFVFVKRFAERKQWRWTAYSAISGVAAPALVALGIANPTSAGVPFLLAATVAFGWLAVLAIGLLAESSVRFAGPDLRR
jgi:hypothetical membrane protein